MFLLFYTQAYKKGGYELKVVSKSVSLIFLIKSVDVDMLSTKLLLSKLDL